MIRQRLEVFILIMLPYQQFTKKRIKYANSCDYMNYLFCPFQTSTFQLVIVSDGLSTTLAFFSYQAMMFTNKENLIGFATELTQSYRLRVYDPVNEYFNLGNENCNRPIKLSPIKLNTRSSFYFLEQGERRFNLLCFSA